MTKKTEGELTTQGRIEAKAREVEEHEAAAKALQPIKRPPATLEERQLSALELIAINSERIAVALERIADALPGTKPHTLPGFDPTPSPTLDG